MSVLARVCCVCVLGKKRESRGLFSLSLPRVPSSPRLFPCASLEPAHPLPPLRLLIHRTTHPHQKKDKPSPIIHLYSSSFSSLLFFFKSLFVSHYNPLNPYIWKKEGEHLPHVTHTHLLDVWPAKTRLRHSDPHDLVAYISRDSSPVTSTKMAAVTKPQEMVKKPKDLKSFTSESFHPRPSLGPGRVIGPFALGNR